MKDKPIAFDDKELRNWLMDLIEEGPESFLCALAEAVVRADAEDYGVIRPALVELKRRYNDGSRRRSRLRIYPVRGVPPDRRVRSYVQ